MKITNSIDFEFSGCDYHPPPPPGAAFGLDVARAFLCEAGTAEPTPYQLNLFRDLLLAVGREVAQQMKDIEPRVRADVERRRGYDEWSEAAIARRTQTAVV